MCCCPEPNVNGEPGYSWDGKSVSTRPVAPPMLIDGDVLLFDEPGRCGGMDSHCYHYRLVKHAGSTVLAVQHGGGPDRVRLSLPRGFTFEAVDSNTRYWLLNAMYHAHYDGRSDGSTRTSQAYRKAFADGRLKKRNLPKQGTVKVWIEPLAGLPAASASEVR